MDMHSLKKITDLRQRSGNNFLHFVNFELGCKIYLPIASSLVCTVTHHVFSHAGYLCAAKGPGEVLRHTERTHMSGRFTPIFICTVCLCVHVCENVIEF